MFKKDDLKRPANPVATDLKTLWRTTMDPNRDLPDNLDAWLIKPKIELTRLNPKLTWLAHSTFLVEIDGLIGLLDPFWGDYKVAGVTLYKRLVPPPIPIEELPKIDFICISHNHTDHCDTNALKTIVAKNDKIIAFIPFGDRKLFENIGYANIREFKWYDSVRLEDVTLTFLPAAHSANNDSWFGSWLFQIGDRSFYHAGDTGYSNHFKEISDVYNIDVAILPIAPYTMRDLHEPAHTDQVEAIKAFIDLNAKIFVPMHWGTLPFCNDKFDECIQIMTDEWNNKQLYGKELKILKFGETFYW
jgi:L-ascorbate metabolism protein UlaG (beta-lactamase superfamily)